LETAENITQPVLKKIDDTLHIDDKGGAILNKIENTAQGITSTASNYYTHKKENAIEVTNNIITTANRPVNYLLDYTESLLDHVLPPHHEPIVPVEIDTEDDDSLIESSELDHTAIVENPIHRIKRITLSVPLRFANFRAEKLDPLQTETVGYANEILKYAYDTIDVEGKKSLIYENASTIQNRIDEKREDIKKLVGPAKEILERQTADIKDLSVKALVTSVSVIAHVSEIIRRQMIGRVIEPAKLHLHLNEITRLTKIAITTLKEQELTIYIQKFKETSLVTIQALIDLTYAYTPEKLAPLLYQLSKHNIIPAQGAPAHTVDQQQSDEPKTDST